MTPTLSVAAAQPLTVSGDVAGNVVEHADAVRRAGARLVVFPELSLTGYVLDAELVAVTDPALAPLVDACRDAAAVALVGAPVRDESGPHIAVLAVTGDGVEVAYRKSFLGEEERARFVPGPGATAIDVDGWRVGIGVCKDTGVEEHVVRTAALGVDLYVAGVVHHSAELEEQDRRGLHLARSCDAPVVLASFAGATGHGYADTAGTSTLWAADGQVLARAGREPGDVVGAAVTR